MGTTDSHAPHRLGRWGEERAARFLVGRGYEVVARNYRFGRREIDIIVRRGTLYAFVEVKTRAGLGFGVPEEAVTRRKRREIEAVATDFLFRRRLDSATVRFDVVSVLVDRDRRVVRTEHIEDAWRPAWP
jgi:putative endonuclease